MRRTRRSVLPMALAAGVLWQAVAAPAVQAQDRGARLTSGGDRDRRVALVIGNAAYASGALRNPRNDADDMAAMLTELGFEVDLMKDVNQRQMKVAIHDLGKKLSGGGIGVFYFAGHGVQVGGKNYLMPVGAEITRRLDVELEAVKLDRVLGEMEEARNDLNLVILDACRNNPYRSFRNLSRGLLSLVERQAGRDDSASY